MRGTRGREGGHRFSAPNRRTFPKVIPTQKKRTFTHSTAGGKNTKKEEEQQNISHHLARDDAVELPWVLLGEVSVVDELERDEVLQTARHHLATNH